MVAQFLLLVVLVDQVVVVTDQPMLVGVLVIPLLAQ
tara:strand:- start:128 stop:235 length:108 start_codon:yes stop_codon:yes gene_type:complete